MAGDREVEEARNLVESLNVSKQITFSGWIDTEARDQLLDQGSVFVLPSYNEVLPLSILEAMAWGLPVIVTPVGGISEIVNNGENRLVVEPSNTEQLSSAMKSLIVNEDLRTSLGDQGRKSLEPLDSDFSRHSSQAIECWLHPSRDKSYSSLLSKIMTAITIPRQTDYLTVNFFPR